MNTAINITETQPVTPSADEIEHQAASSDAAGAGNPEPTSAANESGPLHNTPDTMDTPDTPDTVGTGESAAAPSDDPSAASEPAVQSADAEETNRPPAPDSMASADKDIATNPDTATCTSADGNTPSASRDAGTEAEEASPQPVENAAPATPQVSVTVVNIQKRTRRGASGTRDHIWTRHHALCQMALILDVKFGGCGAASPAIPEPKLCPFLKEVPGKLIELSPWILNAAYLNLEDSRAMKKYGIQHGFFTWAVNRLYYFFHPKGHREHPSTRAQLKDVYQEFYDTFRDDVATGSTISEDRAKDFWLSVADRVPFQLPCKPAPVAIISQTSGDAAQMTDTIKEVSHV